MYPRPTGRVVRAPVPVAGAEAVGGVSELGGGAGVLGGVGPRAGGLEAGGVVLAAVQRVVGRAVQAVAVHLQRTRATHTYVQGQGQGRWVFFGFFFDRCS